MAAQQGGFGVAPVREKVQYGAFKATQLGAAKTWDMTVMTLSMMKKIIAGSVSAENLVGPVGIVKIAGDSVRVGLAVFSQHYGVMRGVIGCVEFATHTDVGRWACCFHHLGNVARQAAL